MSNNSAGDRDAIRVTLRMTRAIAAALIAGVLFACVVAVWLPPLGTSLTMLVVPVALAGLVSPVVGYRVYHVIRDRIPPGAAVGSRCAVFQRATIVALAVTEGTAFLGVVVYLLSNDLAALVGVVTHVLLTGAIWPSPRRLEGFIGSEAVMHLPE